jgi:P27 family predicted phage terminase small subunit
MTAGRKPKPSELKLLTGNPGKRPVRRAPGGQRQRLRAPAPPEWLPEDGQREWRRVAPLLLAMRVLRDTDLTALAVYCESYARYRQAQQELQDNGSLTTDTGTGSIKTHPSVTVLNQAVAQMRAFMVEFGLTPSSRGRVASEAPRELSEFEQYLARKNRTADQAEERAA